MKFNLPGSVSLGDAGGCGGGDEGLSSKGVVGVVGGTYAAVSSGERVLTET